MQRISEEPSSILDKGPDPESVLEAACCSELAAQLGELASFVKKASNVFLKLNEQVRLKLDLAHFGIFHQHFSVR